MKIYIKILLIALFGIQSTQALAQNTDTTMIVNGVCGMCKRTIEKAALVKGVSFAEWSPETKVLKLRFDSAKVKLNKINKSITASGYDTEYEAAPDEAYNKLHHCCHYRDPEVVKEHEAEREAEKEDNQ